MDKLDLILLAAIACIVLNIFILIKVSQCPLKKQQQRKKHLLKNNSLAVTVEKLLLRELLPVSLSVKTADKCTLT